MSERLRGDAARASVGFIAAYAFAYVALWLALLTPVLITLALRIRQIAPVNAAQTVSLVLGVGALLALVSNPIFGTLSDRTTSCWGRRRPWLVGGILCGLAALAFIGRATTISAVLVGWCIAQLAFNAVLAALAALLPDQVPKAQRGTMSGLIGLSVPLGEIGGTFLVQKFSDHLLLAFTLPGVISAAGMLVLALTLRDPPLATGTQRSGKSGRAWFTLPHQRNFSWVLLSRAFFVMGISFLKAYQPFFLLETLRIPAAEIPQLIFVSTAVQAGMIAVWSLITGMVSDSTGRRRAFVFAGAAVQAIGLWLIAGAGSRGAFLAAVAMVGIGHGAYVGVDLALVAELFPDRHRHAARDFGILNIANTLPQVVAPLVAPGILELTDGNYALLFVMAGCVSLLGSVFLLPLKSIR